MFVNGNIVTVFFADKEKDAATTPHPPSYGIWWFYEPEQSAHVFFTAF